MKVLTYVPELQAGRCFERLIAAGYQVVQAHDEKMAWEYLCEQWRPVLILDLDLVEPDFVASIRQEKEDVYVYVIGMASSDDAQLDLASSTLPVDEFLVKPVEPDELIARLAIVNRYMQTLTELRSKRRSPEPLRDVKTGTFSQPTIKELLYTEMSRAQRMRTRFSVALMEVSNLGKIRKQYGQKAVDRAMIQVALKVWASLRTYDLIGRWTENSFLLVFPETSLRGALTVAERISQKVGGIPLTFDKDTFQLQINLGVASPNPSEPSSLQALLGFVNQAVTCARNDDRRSVVNHQC